MSCSAIREMHNTAHVKRDKLSEISMSCQMSQLMHVCLFSASSLILSEPCFHLKSQWFSFQAKWQLKLNVWAIIARTWFTFCATVSCYLSSLFIQHLPIIMLQILKRLELFCPQHQPKLTRRLVTQLTQG